MHFHPLGIPVDELLVMTALVLSGNMPVYVYVECAKDLFRWRG